MSDYIYPMEEFYKLMILTLLFMGIVGINSIQAQPTDWIAPSDAASFINPLENNSTSQAVGKILFKQNCAICHGKKGKGDGIAGMALSQPYISHSFLHFGLIPIASATPRRSNMGGIMWQLSFYSIG